MKKLLILALVLFIHGSTYAKSTEVIFSGANLESKEIGILIKTDQERKTITVASPVYNYAFKLPYVEYWVFIKNSKYYLFGHNGHRDISINIYKIDQKPDEAYLETMKNKLLQNKEQNKTAIAEIISFNGIPVLKTIVEVGKYSEIEELKDTIQQNIFITKTNGKARFVLHFSILTNNSNQAEFIIYQHYLTKTFITDFMLE